MPSSRLMLVLEPEAAFTFCYQTNKERLLFAEKSMQCGFLPGTKCLILDAGGWFIQWLIIKNKHITDFFQLFTMYMITFMDFITYQS